MTQPDLIRQIALILLRFLGKWLQALGRAKASRIFLCSNFPSSQPLGFEFPPRSPVCWVISGKSRRQHSCWKQQGESCIEASDVHSVRRTRTRPGDSLSYEVASPDTVSSWPVARCVMWQSLPTKANRRAVEVGGENLNAGNQSLPKFETSSFLSAPHPNETSFVMFDSLGLHTCSCSCTVARVGKRTRLF